MATDQIVGEQVSITNKEGLIDLDNVVTGKFTVRIKGTDYRLPKSVPLDTAFKLMSLFERLQGTDKDAEGNAEVNAMLIQDIFEEIAGLFTENYPEMNYDKLKVMISFQQAVYMLTKIVGEIFAMEDQAGNP